MPATAAANNNVSGSQAPTSNSSKMKKDKLAALAALQWEIEEDERKWVAEEERKWVEKAKLEVAKWAKAMEAKKLWEAKKLEEEKKKKVQGKERQREESEKEEDEDDKDRSETEEPSAPKKQKLVSDKRFKRNFTNNNLLYYDSW